MYTVKPSIKPRNRNRRKRRRIIFMIKSMIVLCGIIVIAILGYLLFQVREIKVEGNTYVTKKSVEEIITEDKYSSVTIYAWFKARQGKYEMPVYLEGMEVKMENPWTLILKIEEKKPLGYLSFNEKYVYFDKDGLVLEVRGDRKEGVSNIEGIEISGAELYKKLQVTETIIFENIAEVLELLKKSALVPERIVCAGKEVELYFENICVKLGSGNYEDRILQISPLLEKLVGQTGILHLEEFIREDSSIRFEKAVVPIESDEEPIESNEDSMENGENE